MTTMSHKLHFGENSHEELPFSDFPQEFFEEKSHIALEILSAFVTR